MNKMPVSKVQANMQSAGYILVSFRAGRGLRDKAILFIFCFDWFFKAFLRTLGFKCGRPILIADVVVKLWDGLYRCRKGTDDAAIILSPVEEPVRRFIRENLIKGVFIDLGAHIGLYTVLGGKLLCGKGRVIAIEPEPSNFEALKANIELNGLDNVIALNVAANDRNGEVTLWLPSPKGAKGWCTLLPQHQSKKQEQIRVRAVRLDDSIGCTASYDDITLVKVDVEGAEERVFEGMKRILQLPTIQILFEWGPGPSLLAEMGFRVEPVQGSLMYRAWKNV